MSDTRAFWFQCTKCGATAAFPVRLLDPSSWRDIDGEGGKCFDVPAHCVGHPMLATHMSGHESDAKAGER